MQWQSPQIFVALSGAETITGKRAAYHQSHDLIVPWFDIIYKNKY